MADIALRLSEVFCVVHAWKKEKNEPTILCGLDAQYDVRADVKFLADGACHF